ncbi:MAG: F0F1 ATP synthase subunit gamma [Alphaproteobacteria bacterium]|nr:MAG: F0F1 ATP synthase subunit gamma [Alphaproteobacteria bacterium]
MPSLKDLRDRITSVKSTRKITSAMKMVAASKLKRAQSQAEASQPYARHMGDMLERLVSNITISDSTPALLRGTGSDQTHLLVVITSDRGLCGGFNAFITREVRKKAKELMAQGKEIKFLCVGRKGRDALKREFGSKILGFFEGPGKKGLSFSDAHRIGEDVLLRFEAGEFDVCHVFYNVFKSVIAQIPTAQQLIPFAAAEDADADTTESTDSNAAKAVYEFEPSEDGILHSLLPQNVSVQIFRSMLDSAAGEQAARMTAMDNATRNAGDRIAELTLNYNRARQAYITKELIEIISGAEAV